MKAIAYAILFVGAVIGMSFWLFMTAILEHNSLQYVAGFAGTGFAVLAAVFAICALSHIEEDVQIEYSGEIYARSLEEQ